MSTSTVAIRPDCGPLRQVIEAASRATSAPLADLTVLATQNDPYRIDTAAGHRDGAWLAIRLDRALAGSGRGRIHLRGLHYSIVARGNVTKPNGEIYRNTDPDWVWLQAHPVKAARWLGYVPFEKIADERNEPPSKYRRSRATLRTSIRVGVTVDIPDADDLEPHVVISGFEGHQPYHIVIFGEKSSLGDVLQPLAAWYDADLYLPTGEITDTLLYEMAKDGAADGRPMQVFPLSDCDPAGWQMPISIARKLQALRDLHFPRLEFAVWPVGLTHDQVRRLRLPSTPLKETERRADRWRQAFGVEQTEIDALAPLQPAVLSEIVQAAIRPFYDAGLAARISQAEAEWSKAAQAALAEHSDGGQLAAVRAQAAEKLAELEEEIDALNQALEQTVPDDIPLPPIVIPDADVRSELHGKPLVSSDDDWWTATRALIDRKRYADDEGRAGA